MSARDLLADLTAAGFELTAQGGSLVVSPASRLTDAQRAAVRTHRTDLLALVADRDAAAVHAARVARLVRQGWDRTAAADVADRLVQRDRSDDSRVACVECRHYRPGRCANHRAAGLQADAVGRELAALLQRCPGFAPVAPHPLASGRNTEDTAP